MNGGKKIRTPWKSIKYFEVFVFVIYYLFLFLIYLAMKKICIIYAEEK